MISNKFIQQLSSILLATVLLGCGDGTSSSNKNIEEVTTSGVAVDGYLEGSIVTLNGASTTTDENGQWSIPISSFTTDENIVSIMGGTDTASKGAFEGELKSVYDPDADSNVATPLTTLITSLVENNSATLEEATSTISQSLGVPSTILSQDPIALLESENASDKIAAATVLQQALVVQKLSEIIGNATSSNEETKINVMNQVFDVISNRLHSNTGTNFTTILSDVNTTITSLNSELLDLNISSKLDAVKDTAVYTVSMISDLNTSSFNTSENLDNIEQAIEKISSDLETVVQEIANAKNAEEVISAKSNATTVQEEITSKGGLNGLIEDFNEGTITGVIVDQNGTINMDGNNSIMPDNNATITNPEMPPFPPENNETILDDNGTVIIPETPIIDQNNTSEDINESTYIEEYLDNNFTTDDWTDATHTKNVDPNFDEVFIDTEVKRLDFVITPQRWQSMLDDMTALYGEFGSTSNNITEGTPPTDLPQMDGTGQVGVPPTSGTPPDNIIFNDATQTDAPITDTITTLDSTEDPIFVPTDVYYTGTDDTQRQWYKVGARFKGNSSLKTAWESGILKLSFKLDFDEFEDDYLDADGEKMIKNQRFYGFKKFSLKNNYDDDSFLREKVASDIFRDAGVASSNTGFYTLYIDHGNGPEYFGLYTLVEEVDGSVLDTQFSSDDGNLYKPEDGNANFVGTFDPNDTNDTQYFEKKTNDDEDEADWSDVASLFIALHDTSRTSDAETWRANLESVFDVDTFLKYLAVNGVIQNWDTYGRMIHNYYLYNNPDNGLLTWIPWDNNEALQDGKLGGSLAFDFSDIDVNEWPLIENIYADATYRAKYDTYIEDVIDNKFNTTTMQAKYDTYKELIENYATTEREGYTFLNSNIDNTIEFESAIDTLKIHVTNRAINATIYLNTDK